MVKKYSFKYFIGYNDNDDIRPLCIKLPQMIGYAKYFDSNKTMSFKVSDKRLLKKYIRIWEKISSLIEKEFDIVINHSSDIDFIDFMKIYKKYIAEPYSFLVSDTTLPSDNPLRFRKNILEKNSLKRIYNKSRRLMIRLKMKNYNMILIEELQKYQSYHQAKLISMNILQAKKYWLLIESR